MTTENKLEVYDLSDVYEQQVKPLIKQLFDICDEHKLPFLIGCCYKGDGEGVHYTNSVTVKAERVPLNFYAAARILEEEEFARAAEKLYKVMDVIAETGATVAVKATTLEPPTQTKH